MGKFNFEIRDPEEIAPVKTRSGISYRGLTPILFVAFVAAVFALACYYYLAFR
jgi:hypothetical protein